MKKLTLIALLLCGLFKLQAQETFPVNGTREKDVVPTALTNATIHIDASTTIDSATIVIHHGRVVSVGQNIPIPENALKIDVMGRHIYPSFVDLDSKYGQPEVTRPKWDPKPQLKSNTKGAFGWNQSVKPEVKAADDFAHDPKSVSSLRANGFGAVMAHAHDGVARGTSCLVALGENENYDLIIPEAAAHYAFDKGSSRQNYPSSLMGMIALLRQSYCDAEWYGDGDRREENLSLQAWNKNQDLPQVFEVKNVLDILRADKIGDEFDVQYIFKASTDVYKRLDAVQATEGSLIIPLNFPAAYDVSDPYNTRLISLREMKDWEMAPSGPARIAEAGIPFAITSSGAEKEFLASLRKTVKYGLSKEDALKALTETPARLIGAENELGKLSAGMRANLLITSGDLFNEKTVINENWVQGERYVLQAFDFIDIRGEYNLSVADAQYPLSVKGRFGKPKASIEHITTNEEGVADTSQVAVSISQNGNLLTLTFTMNDDHFDGLVRLAGNVHLESRIWDGQGETPEGRWIDWVAVRQSEIEKKEAKVDSTSVPEMGPVTYPFMAYGWDSLPEVETVLIKNATLWTCEEEGKIEKGQILLHNGKIAAIGKEIDLTSVFGKQQVTPQVIDAKGKHVTPGLIDEHSHIAATRGVNEGSQASSAEVEVGSVINSEDINIYRQLAGGVTASQILHGSANPIGGQSGMIKLRWGQLPEAMLVNDAPGFIKFALGENVKQTNWGDYATIRFPQTRMGVEQVYYDHFILAREYGERWKKHDEAMSKLSRRQIRNGQIPDAPRRDLELETLYEILQSERFVTCHSYQQGEINMLMHVADSMGFRLNTFTHILEGYKVADKMAAHGAGGSSFSDWWAYKYEVKDAIPHNGALLWEQGIVTAFNSDDREMARRLNQEAAKAVKYGNVPEEEALKFVTLNPAKLLHLEDRMGSLKVGKDADLVIWDDHPLSIYTKAEKTFIDGICYYDKERDEAIRKEIKKERARLIQKMAEAAGKGEKTQKPKRHKDKDYHCDTIYNEFE